MELAALLCYHALIKYQASFYVFLGVIPSASSVRMRNAHLDPTNDGSRQEPYQGLRSEEEAEGKGSQSDLSYQVSTKIPGSTISFRADLVLIITHDL